MKAIFTFTVSFFFLFFQNLTGNSQCAMTPVSLEKRVAASSAIAQGRVTEKNTYIDKSTGYVYTLNKVTVNAWLKNHSTAREIQVITLGGVYGNKATIAYPSLQLTKGAEYLFFLEGNNLKQDDKKLRLQNPSVMQTRVYAEMQGAIRNEGNNYKDLFSPSAVSESVMFSKISKLSRSRVLTPSGKEFAARKAVNVAAQKQNAPLALVSNFSPSGTNGGTIVPGEYITITGSGFGAAQGEVYFSNADDGGGSYVSSGVASDITSWSDNSITVKVPSSAGTGDFLVVDALSNATASGSALTVGYSHLEINHNFAGFASTTRQRFYLRNLNGLGGYTFLFNNAFNANTAAVNSFNRALSTWQCATGVNFRSGGATALGAANDGSNVVLFDASLPSGVLGMAVSNYTASANGLCNNQNTVWWSNDIDVRFAADPPVVGFPWQYGPALAVGVQVDFESVSVHELGHAIGLGHRIAPGQVMNWNISNGTNVRTPSANEISGVNAKLTYSTAATCFNPLGSGSPMMLSGCSLPVTFISFSGERETKTTNNLKWNVSNSANNTGYAVERSADGENFVQLGFVAETPASSSEKSYDYADTKAGVYPWYYRLKQTDIDGKYSYSKVIFLKGDNNNNWRAFASPDGSTIHLYGSLPADNTMHFQLMSSTGQQVMNRLIGTSVTEISASKLSKGIYYYQFTDNSNRIVLSGSLLLGH